MNGKKLIKTIYPAAIVLLIYILVTALREIGVVNGY